MIHIKDITNWEQAIGNVVCGDCLDLMKLIPDKSIDLVLTDPPYNENYNYSRSGAEYKDDRKDYYEFIENIVMGAKRILKDSGSAYLKHSSKQINKIIPIFEKYFIYRNLIIWISNSQAHPNGNYDSYYEPIYFYTKTNDYTFNKRAEYRDKPPNYWSGEGKEFVGLLTNCWYDIKKDQAGCLNPEVGAINNLKIHPCSMPIRLAERAINISSNKNDIIIDPFIGSGTTAIASEIMGRRWIGVEISEAYCAIADKWIKAERDQLKLNL